MSYSFILVYQNIKSTIKCHSYLCLLYLYMCLACFQNLNLIQTNQLAFPAHNEKIF